MTGRSLCPTMRTAAAIKRHGCAAREMRLERWQLYSQCTPGAKGSGDTMCWQKMIDLWRWLLYNRIGSHRGRALSRGAKALLGRTGALVATLGTEPQVVTLALDWLREQRERIVRVVVLHTVPPDDSDVAKALQELSHTFEHDPAYQNGPMFETVPIALNGVPVADVTTRDEALAVLDTIYQELESLKEEGLRIHFCPAGGRKAMSMYAMLVALFLLDEDDHLWLLVSSDELRLDRRLHARPGEAWLLPMPVIAGLAARRRFVGGLTEKPREVLELLVSEGLGDREIADRCGKSRKTVETQLAEIRQNAGIALGLERVDRQVLIAEFAPYFMLKDRLDELLVSLG